jgi:6-pyruvoyl-tetrahydropterin synthase
MYSIGVRDHIVVAHSSALEALDPAPRSQGAPCAVAIELECDELDRRETVIESAQLREALRAVLGELDHRDLDKLPAFAEHAVTAEVIVRHIHRELGRRLAGHRGLLTVTLEPSQASLARYRGPLRNPSLPPPSEA